MGMLRYVPIFLQDEKIGILLNCLVGLKGQCIALGWFWWVIQHTNKVKVI